MRSFLPFLASVVLLALSTLALPTMLETDSIPQARDRLVGFPRQDLPDVIAITDISAPGLVPIPAGPPPTPFAARQDATKGDCNVSGQYCCDSTISHSTASSSALASLLGLPLSALPDPSSSMGLGCSPLASVLSGSNTCTGQQVCCKGTHTFNGGVINTDCSSFSLPL